MSNFEGGDNLLQQYISSFRAAENFLYQQFWCVNFYNISSFSVTELLRRQFQRWRKYYNGSFGVREEEYQQFQC